MDWATFKSFRRGQLRSSPGLFWIYRSTDGFYCPDDHLALDGVVLPPDHPFWDRWFPPHYQGCRCYVSAANYPGMVRRLGGDPEKALPTWWEDVDPSAGSFDL